MRLLRRLLLTLTALVLILAATLAALIWNTLPPNADTAAIPGLSAPVHIALDNDGIPRIEAATPADAAAALGYLHARDRMAQMDIMRRAASGRISELAGPATLRLDRTMRLFGLRRRAEADLAGLDAETRAMLDAYAAGVNAAITKQGRFAAPEFLLFGPPEPWTPVDSLLWGKTMALYLAGNWRNDIDRAALLTRLPPERLRTLWPGQDHTPAPNAFLDPATLGGTLLDTRLTQLVPAFPEPFTWPDHASNEWAVDGAHSTTGKPLLAGDPHLGYGMPGIWYLARVQTPQAVLAGATAPGIPFLVIGHNGRIAWTFTTTGADTQDAFVETAAPNGGYMTEAGPRPFDTRTETIHVRGAPDFIQTVRETRHGPLVSDLEDDPASPLVALSMAALYPGDRAASGLFALNRATTVPEAGRAAPLITNPVQNLLVADPGGIGQFTTGRVPIRRAGDGTLPQPGQDGAHDWTGFASGDALPHQADPPSGHLLNANERTAPPDFPVFMGQDWPGDWRARRIRTLLDARSTHSVASFTRMQTDSVSAFAQLVLPRLLRTQPSDAPSRAALARLARWDADMRVDRPEPLLFDEWVRRINASLLNDEHLTNGQAGLPSDIVARALGPDEAQWCGPSCPAMLARTLAEAASSHDPEETWGALHQAEFANPLLGRLPLIGRFFTTRIEQPGDATTVFAGSMVSPSWSAVHGPGFRGIYDLSDLANSRFIATPGQSGNPFSHNAASLMQRWRNGEGIPLGAIAYPAATIDLHP